MIRKRDGPAPGRPARGPGVDECDARLLPRSESPRKSRAQPTTPKIRGFSVRLYLKPGSDAHALYALLRLAAERYGLEVASVDEIDPE